MLSGELILAALAIVGLLCLASPAALTVKLPAIFQVVTQVRLIICLSGLHLPTFWIGTLERLAALLAGVLLCRSRSGGSQAPGPCLLAFAAARELTVQTAPLASVLLGEILVELVFGLCLLALAALLVAFLLASFVFACRAFPIRLLEHTFLC